MQCPGNKDVLVTEGKIEEIKNNKNIIHSLSTDDGSSGSHITLSIRNLNIIGIHQAKFKDNNKGVYLKCVLEDLEKQYLKFLENNSIIKPIGTYKYKGKILDRYSKEQFKENEQRCFKCESDIFCRFLLLYLLGYIGVFGLVALL